MITVTAFTSLKNQQNNTNGKTYTGKSICEIYSQINKNIAQNVKGFYAWNGRVSDGASLAPLSF